MVLPAQFQLGLELTNIVNPISQAVSALGSLALIDAIKKSGSNFITETKLASLIGRHRIDPVIKFHFREMVAKSDQSVISRYLDIILESGSGPTVQEALKNPALFSMVIQLSGLAFAHEDESLANAIVEAIENIVQESGGDLGIVPDYVSLLGTIRACQQQTAAFRWALLYEAAEEKIHKALAGLDNSSDGISGSIKFRSLPRPVLQGLLMWLQSLQNFPEHRLLHLRCNTGISTVIVWCHHMLGLSLTVQWHGIEICFGDAPYNLVVEESQSQKAVVSLMDPLDPQEPLFTLEDDENCMEISYEHRAEAYGYGTKLLQFQSFPEHELQERAQWVISYSIERCRGLDKSDVVSDAGTVSLIDAIKISPRSLSEARMLRAGRFLFALDESTTISGCTSRNWEKHSKMLTLVAILIMFAGISEGDLARCREIPLALNNVATPLEGILRHSDDPQGFLNLAGSFKMLSFLLLGRHMSHDDYVKPAILVSAWGWSIFFDSIDSIDPFDVPTDILRILRGVPSRRGLRRTRIIDGPKDVSVPTTLQPSSNGEMRIHLAPGVSTAESGVILVGHHSDAFQVTQQFTCHLLNFSDQRTCRYGFRQMMEWSISARRLPPCQCDKSSSELSKTSSVRKISVIDRYFEVRDGPVQRFAEPDSTNKSLQFPDLERVFTSRDWKRCFVYVSDKPAPRWLQLGILQSYQNFYCVVLGDPNTCVDCAVRNSERLPPKAIILL